MNPETFPIIIGAIIPTCFSFHCVLSAAVVLCVQPRMLVASLTKSRGERRDCRKA